MLHKNSAPFAVLIQSLTHKLTNNTTCTVHGLSTNSIHSLVLHSSSLPNTNINTDLCERPVLNCTLLK